MLTFPDMLAAHNLQYTYPGSPRPALQGLDFQIERGEVFGFLGSGGAGKSTLQKILVGLLRDYSGTVTFQGKELGDWSRDFYERIGVSPELPNHFRKLTAWENLAYSAQLYSGGTEPLALVLEQVGLAGEAHKRVGGFSPGMNKRLGMARALLHRPEALFLDEPAAGLDPADMGTIKDLIRAQGQAGRTVVLATRDPALAEELCDRVAMLEEGRIRVIGRPRAPELRNGPGPA